MAEKRPGWHEAAKTHCPKGHPYSAENTGSDRGKRTCRICKREQNRRWARANPEQRRRRG